VSTSDDLSALTNFNGVARLFPLPNVVFFPQVMLPLHIFEPRYRQMTADALAGDRLLAMALLQPGWEAEHADRPPLHPIACLGQIVADQALEDGRYNILLRGISRIRIVEEVPQDRLYRCARVELLTDASLPETEAARRIRRELVRSVTTWLTGLGLASGQMRKLLRSDLPLGTLADILSFALPVPTEFKQELLAELDVGRRAERLLEHLESNEPPKATAGDRQFPPDFSNN
jgi:Lon protease-like protein